jgi:hypothetical protein
MLGHGQPQHTVAEEFQALVIGDALLAMRGAGMRQRLIQKHHIVEAVADPLLKFIEIGTARHGLSRSG